MDEALDNIQRAFDRLRAMERELDSSWDEIVGVGVDDFDNIEGICTAALVARNRLISFYVSPEILEYYLSSSDSDEEKRLQISSHITTVIKAAFDDWNRKLAQRVVRN